MPGIINILAGNKHHLTKFLCEHQQVSSMWYLASNDKADLAAIRFIKHTSSYNLKANWFVHSALFDRQCDAAFEKFLASKYAYELERQSTQNKYVHIPYGVVFAN